MPRREVKFILKLLREIAGEILRYLKMDQTGNDLQQILGQAL